LVEDRFAGAKNIHRNPGDAIVDCHNKWAKIIKLKGTD